MESKLVKNATVAMAAVAVLSTAAACSSNSKSGNSSSSSAGNSSSSSSAVSDSASASTPAGSGGGTTTAKGIKVAFLMPDNGSTRYELHDHPGFVKQMSKDCPTCQVIYNNAGADSTKQQNQFNSALTQGAKVIVLDPVDSAAAKALVAQAQAKGVKVIAYDRPIPDGKPDYYVSFNNERIGMLISKSLVAKIKSSGAVPSGSGILEVNGSPTDAAAGLIKKGIHEGLAGSGIKTLAEYDTPDWDPSKAQQWVSGQVSRFGKKIVGVVAANDGTGGGAIAAFKAAGGSVPPVTGNDATVAGLQLIINGDEYNTISKPSEIVAAAAADVAVQLAQGKTVAAKTTVFGAPSQLFTPLVITQTNLKAQIIDKKLNTVAELCTAAYKAGCTKLGIS